MLLHDEVQDAEDGCKRLAEKLQERKNKQGNHYSQMFLNSYHYFDYLNINTFGKNEEEQP